ncbi:MAG: hypothetical protein AAF700_14895, partial [Pseudomonadota bacterium]
MGMLIDGAWHGDIDRFMQNGSFKREASALPQRSIAELVRTIGNGAKAVLIASPSCPWSHRTTLVRGFKGLTQIPVAPAGGPRTQGYALYPDSAPGPVRHVHQLYTMTDPVYTGRATVPLLWDASKHQIMCNESATIARVFDQLGEAPRLAPASQTAAIEALNRRIYDGLSNGVYRAGFATTQGAYNAAVNDVYDTLDWLEARLQGTRCLLGSQITEA